MADHNEPLENAIRSLMSSSFGIEESSITSDTPFTELPLDSLDAVNFMMECEEAFSVNIPDEDAEQIVTLRDAVAVINSPSI